MAKPTVAIRVPGELYDDLVKIADDRDVTITQALDIHIRRQRRPTGVRTGKGDKRSGLEGRVSKPTRASKKRAGKAKEPTSPARKLIEGASDIYED